MALFYATAPQTEEKSVFGKYAPKYYRRGRFGVGFVSQGSIVRFVELRGEIAMQEWMIGVVFVVVVVAPCLVAMRVGIENAED
jgi:hypothetical protein